DRAAAVVAVLQVGLVDQAQVDDVERDFRVEAGAQLVPDHGLDFLVAGIVRKLQLGGGFLADGVGILARDPEEVALHEHGVAAAQSLGDVADAAGRKGHGFALRHHDGGAVALETDGFAATGVHAADMGQPACTCKRPPAGSGEALILAHGRCAYAWPPPPTPRSDAPRHAPHRARPPRLAVAAP